MILQVDGCVSHSSVHDAVDPVLVIELQAVLYDRLQIALRDPLSRVSEGDDLPLSGRCVKKEEETVL